MLIPFNEIQNHLCSPAGGILGDNCAYRVMRCGRP